MKFVFPTDLTIIGSLVVIIVIAGCVSGEIDPRPGSGDIGIYFNDADLDEPGFYLNATVDLSLNVEDTIVFEHVMICLYDRGGTLMSSADVGTFKSPTDRNTVNVSAKRIPQYVVVTHPKFEEYDTLGPLVLSWNEGEETFEDVRPDDLPFDYPRNMDIGECP